MKPTILGVVTLYNPDIESANNNIQQYAPYVEKVIVWDNSPICHQSQIVGDNLIYHWTGQNTYIAPAINYAWEYAQANSYDLILIMDQDSHWANFSFFRTKVEELYAQEHNVYVPYIAGNDNWIFDKEIVERRIFINSGTIIPTDILTAINGADEVFEMDALDHDLAIRIQKANYKILCITSCILYHTVGHPKRSKWLHLFTNDYGRERTYSIAKCHLIKYRKHKKWFTPADKRKIFKEYYMWKFIRLVLVEEDKIGRFKMFVKGIHDGFRFDLSKTKQ
ncbi:MAG: hypothetical protein MJZ64_06410 [Paludibacteraceae bacterium]|nr:hypothetical protein [Paludibacteraceae bacterium]